MKWTFAQIDGQGERKTLELDGWKAPFGRQRQDAVFKEIIKSRIQTTRYPGGNSQTRHAFGTNWEPTELRGRWMTKQGGASARDMADAWTEFLRDERTLRISWGYIVSFTGYLEELELGREDEHNVAWRMKLQIDTRDDFASRGSLPAPDPVGNFRATTDDLTFFLLGSKSVIPDIPEIEPDFMDSLQNLAAELNKPAAALAKLAGQMEDIEKGTFATIQAFRGAVSNVRTALAQMHDTVVGAAADTAILVRSAESDIAWVKYQLEFDNQATIFMDQLNMMDRQADLAQVSSKSKFITAKEGDSWESLSIRATGSADRAGEIRSMAGAQYGETPVPGESYLVQ